MSEKIIDAAWLEAHPLPAIGAGKDKEARGQLLIVGGSATVCGALRLTGDAALRAGAGRVQLATIADAAIPLGVSFPEAAVFALPVKDGEIDGDAAEHLKDNLEQCDALVIGPGMAECDSTPALVAALLHKLAVPVLLDAGAMTAMCGLVAPPGARILTPHHGELAKMMNCDKEEIASDSVGAAHAAAQRFGAVVVVKAQRTVIASPDGEEFHYRSGVPGLGTAGSGDVLAGVIGGLLARGAALMTAAGWGVWLHGEAGRATSRAIGRIGFRASELPLQIPGLLPQ